MAKNHDSEFYLKQCRRILNEIAQLDGTQYEVFKKLQKKGLKYLTKAKHLQTEEKALREGKPWPTESSQ